MTHWKPNWPKSGAKASTITSNSERKTPTDPNRKQHDDRSNNAASTPQASAKPQHTLLTTDEAAYFLRLSTRTLERFRVEGTGPRYTKAGPGKRARVLYRQSDLENWLNSFQYDSTPQYPRDD